MFIITYLYFDELAMNMLRDDSRVISVLCETKVRPHELGGAAEAGRPPPPPLSGIWTKGENELYEFQGFRQYCWF